MIPLALFPICYVLVETGPQILILWLVFITLHLTWCGAIHRISPSVGLCRPERKWKEERQTMDPHETTNKRGGGREFKELPEWTGLLEQLKEEALIWVPQEAPARLGFLLSGDW